MRAHSQELSDDVCDQHIALYVNEFSIDLGDDGMRAIEALTARSGRPAFVRVLYRSRSNRDGPRCVRPRGSGT